MSVIENLLMQEDEQIKAAFAAMSASEIRKLLTSGYEVGRELDEWKRMAAWMAECHAANAEQAVGLKSVSKHQKDRLVSISKKSAEQMSLVRAERLHRIGSNAQKDVQFAIERCLDVERHRITEEKNDK